MKYRFLGSSGLLISRITLGTMTFGAPDWGCDEKEAHAIVKRFLDAGGNSIDAANVYAAGKSEEILGRFLPQVPREQIVLASKCYFPMGNQANHYGLSRKHVIASCEASLRRLQTDYIDLYQIHGWDPGTPLEETMKTLNNLVESGKVRYIGASNVTAWQLQKAIDISRHNGWEAFSCLQPLYNLLDRELEWDLVPVCLNEGVGIIPWSPLRGGWLSGKYQRGMEKPPDGTRIEEAGKRGWSESWDAYANERTWTILDNLQDVAAQTGKSVAQVALNWLLCMPGVTAPIIGARTLKNLEDNLGAAGWSLTASQMAQLDQASQKPLPYPHNMIAGFSGARQRT